MVDGYYVPGYLGLACANVAGYGTGQLIRRGSGPPELRQGLPMAQTPTGQAFPVQV